MPTHADDQDREPALLAMLADGRFHSGQAIGEQLAISRAAVWKQVRALRAMGLEVAAVKGRGYRLAWPWSRYERSKILRFIADLGGDPGAWWVACHWQIDSTSSRLAAASADASRQSRRLVVADRQSAGRGRRGRGWVSDVPGNIALSIEHRIDAAPSELAGSSIVAGLAVARALNQAYPIQVRLKWPNDLMAGGRKLGGILLELFGEAAGPCRIVTGIGLNLRMPESRAAAIDQPWCDLLTLAGLQTIDRNRLVASIAVSIDRSYQQFIDTGLGQFVAAWGELDFLSGRSVCVRLGQREECGVARGIDGEGALLVEVGGELRRYNAGEVSVRDPSK